jgi:proteasome lid subunit RPN8/RPN11
VSDRLRKILDHVEAMEAFKAHCFMDTENEVCGLFVVSEGLLTYVPCNNHAFDTKNSFLIHPADFVRCSDIGDVIAVGHSHVIGSSDPSNEDRVNSENCLLPFVIFQPHELTIAAYEPRGEMQPLIGRTWRLGVSDCYTLVRDYYKTQSLELQDYLRNDAACLKTESLFLKHFAENGFREVSGPPRLNDGLLIQVLADIPNHVAVMVEDNLILHHIQNRLSCREPFGGYWRKNTVKILRHEKWL